MKFVLNIRGRPEDAAIEDRHASIVTGLESVEWIAQSRMPRLNVKEGELSTECFISRAFRFRATAHLHYHNREYAENFGRCDDFLYVEFEPKRLDYGAVVHDVFPELVRAFKGYLGMIAHGDEWGSRKPFSDFRTSVKQLDLVNFFDRKLCKVALDLTPRQLALQLKSHVKDISYTSDGVFVVATEDILGPRQSRNLGQSLFQVLKDHKERA